MKDRYREKAVSIVDDIIESNKRLHPKINRDEFRLGGFCVYKRTIESRDKYFCVTGTESKRIAITASAAIWNLDAGYKNVSTPIREIFQLIKSRSRALHYRHQFESQTKRRMSPEFQRHLV